MLGDRIDVITRRFDKGFQDTFVLSFSGGPERRPILRPAMQNEWLVEGGTSIKVWLKPSIESSELFDSTGSRSLKTFCDRQFPSIDVSLLTNDGRNEVAIAPLDWESVDPVTLLKKINGLSKIPESLLPFCSNMRPIMGAQGEVLGRMFVAPKPYQMKFGELDVEGSLVARGITVGRVGGLYGVLNANIDRASRLEGKPVVPKENFRVWLNDQARLLAKLALPASVQAECAEVIRSLGGDTQQLKIFRVGKSWLSSEEIGKFIASNDEIIVVGEYYLEQLDELNPDAVLLPNVIGASPSRSSVFDSRYDYDVDRMFRDKGDGGSIEGVLIEAIAREWKLKSDVKKALLKSVVQGERVSIYSTSTIAQANDGRQLSQLSKKIWRNMKASDFPLRIASEDL